MYPNYEFGCFTKNPNAPDKLPSWIETIPPAVSTVFNLLTTCRAGSYGFGEKSARAPGNRNAAIAQKTKTRFPRNVKLVPRPSRSIVRRRHGERQPYAIYLHTRAGRQERNSRKSTSQTTPTPGPSALNVMNVQRIYERYPPNGHMLLRYGQKMISPTPEGCFTVSTLRKNSADNN